MQQMAYNGDTDLDDKHTMEKFIRCMTKKYDQMVLSIETLLNFRQLSVEDVTEHLKAV